MNRSQDTFGKENHTSHKLILIADADTHYGKALAQAVREETPYYALALENGVQVLDLIQSLKPNLVLLNAQLPDMESSEVSNRLHDIKQFKDVPVFFLHAHTYFSSHNEKYSQLKRTEKFPRLETIFDMLQEILA